MIFYLVQNNVHSNCYYFHIRSIHRKEVADMSCGIQISEKRKPKARIIVAGVGGAGAIPEVGKMQR